MLEGAGALPRRWLRAATRKQQEEALLQRSETSRVLYWAPWGLEGPVLTWRKGSALEPSQPVGCPYAVCLGLRFGMKPCRLPKLEMGWAVSSRNADRRVGVRCPEPGHARRYTPLS